ncbi:MAG: spore protease YyaC [Firmicutes bacterium]|nr:spore protease YyaC [Bacillota bacterium]
MVPELSLMATPHKPAQLVILCVGTDRSTGDSLGPLVGTKLLESYRLPPGVQVLGTLEQPVHAGNLEKYAELLQQKHQHSYVLALDACLGKSENIGYITAKEGPLKPGTGVNKQLVEVGTSHLIGVVNVGGFMEYFVLQNTRLSLVMRMAQVMVDALAGLLYMYQRTLYPCAVNKGTHHISIPFSSGSWESVPVAPSKIE